MLNSNNYDFGMAVAQLKSSDMTRSVMQPDFGTTLRPNTAKQYVFKARSLDETLNFKHALTLQEKNERVKRHLCSLD